MKKEDLRDIPLGKGKDLTNIKFGEWVVIKYAGKSKKSNNSYFLCKCSCGIESLIRGQCLTKNLTSSCKPCANKKGKTIHGYRYHPIYNSWISMIDRCYRKKNIAYKYYGGRGITVCSEWRDNIYIFIVWALKNNWEKGLTIDRINNDLGYTPKNCRWVTQQVNSQNTSKTKLNELKVKQIKHLLYQTTMTYKEIAKDFGVNESSIRSIKQMRAWNNITI